MSHQVQAEREGMYKSGALSSEEKVKDFVSVCLADVSGGDGDWWLWGDLDARLQTNTVQWC